MALQGPFPVEFGAVFPSGVYAAGGFEMVRDFERSKGDLVIQQADKITGLPLWVVEVIDADPEARQRTVKVKVAAQYQPVLPDAPAGSPFVPVELLAGTDEPTVKASAHALGYDPERPHRVIVATRRPRDGLDEQFFQAVVREVRRLDVATLIVGRANYIVIIAYREADWFKLQADITSHLPGGTCRLAVGSRYPNAWQVAASYREAQFVVNLSSPAAGHPAGPVLLFDSLGVYRMLSSATDPAGIEAFMNAQLGTLLDYDKSHRSDLLATLAQYFDSGCNIDQAAAMLSIHRSTLKYRLKRVRELLGQDLNDGSTRLDLHLATRVWLTLESLRRTEQA